MRRILNNIKNHTNWLNYYTYKYLDGKNDFVFKGKSGIDINVPKRLLHTYKECFLDETYLRGLPESVDKSKINTIIDIGANVGYFSLFMLSINKNAKVFAYEPIPKNFELLNKYKSENPELDFNIFNNAVTKSDIESITLNFNDSDDFTTSATIFTDQKQQNQLVVKSTSLEKIINDNNLNQVDFVKIDCEGSEYDILYNTSAEIFNKISILAIETHPGNNANENTQALATFIKDKNYQIKIQGDIIWAWKS